MMVMAHEGIKALIIYLPRVYLFMDINFPICFFDILSSPVVTPTAHPQHLQPRQQPVPLLGSG